MAPEIKPQPVILKKGREKSLINRHPWIFSGAVARLPEFEDGDILPVVSSQGEFLGYGYFNRRCSIIGRMLSFDQQPPLEAVEANLSRALALRQQLLSSTTNACRLVNAEGDGLPGLIVDQYNDLLVIQISTLGMVKLKEVVVNWLVKHLKPTSIYEKSDSPARREEGLATYKGWLYGEEKEEVEIVENGLKFIVSPQRGQKTGFFLDQREMRTLVRRLAAGRRVLDCFAYSGAFAVYALAGGAHQVTLVDTSEPALEWARRNLELNALPLNKATLVKQDAFQFLSQAQLPYDFVILDPPSFAHRKNQIKGALRGLRQLHRQVLAGIPAESLLLTFTCSYYVEEKLFQKVVFQAAQQAGRRVRLLHRHRLAFDHPINIFHPEGEYLKGFLLAVD